MRELTSSQESESRVPGWLFAALAACLALSLFSLSFRYRAEARNRAVGLAAEADIVGAFAAAEGKTLGDAIRQLKSAGLTHVALSEETLGSLLSNGRLRVVGTRLLGKQEDVARAAEGLSIRFPSTAVGRPRWDGATGEWALDLAIPVDLARTTAVGLDLDAVAAVQREGVGLVGRYANAGGGTSETVRRTLAWARSQGVSVVLPQGDQVPGRKGAEDAFADAIRDLGLLYASPEFSKIGGDATIVQRIPGSVVRLHTAQTLELDKLPQAEAVDRFVRAARERNQRMLLLRPVSLSSDEPLTDFSHFAAQVSQGVTGTGLAIAAPHGYGEPGVPSWVFAALGVAALGVLFWVASVLIGDPRLLMLAALLLVALAGLNLRDGGRPMLALAVALGFPIAGFLALNRMRPRSAVAGYVLVSVFSLAGGLALAGLLNGLPYLVKAEAFGGVKLAHFAPVVFLPAWFFWKHVGSQALRQPVRWVDAIAALVVLAALVLMATRTGNDNPAAVSAWELKFRDLLDALLVVRPRTKEFLVGHPAMAVACGLLAASAQGRLKLETRRALLIGLMGVGAIGQTSIVNTFAHLHSPLVLNLARVGVGWVAGGILGFAVWAVLQRRAVRAEET